MLYTLKQQEYILTYLSLIIAGEVLILWATGWLDHLPTHVNANNQLCKDYWDEIRMTFLGQLPGEERAHTEFNHVKVILQILVPGHVGTHLFLITLYVAQGAGMGIHLWSHS